MEDVRSEFNKEMNSFYEDFNIKPDILQSSINLVDFPGLPKRMTFQIDWLAAVKEGNSNTLLTVRESTDWNDYRLPRGLLHLREYFIYSRLGTPVQVHCTLAVWNVERSEFLIYVVNKKSNSRVHRYFLGTSGYEKFIDL